MGYRIAVVGATGNVGREMLNILAEREFPADEVAALASRRSLGTEVSFGDKTLKTQDLDRFDFTGWDMALFAIGSEATRQYAPKAAKAGCVVIDNSSLYRYDPEIPLIVPEVNPQAIHGYARKNIIANPNCSTAQMVVALKPLLWTGRHQGAVWSAPTSGFRVVGQGGVGRICGSRQGHVVPGQEVGASVYSQRRSPFNVDPAYHVYHGRTARQGRMEDGGQKTEKIVDPAIKVHRDLVRVPVVLSAIRGGEHRVRGFLIRDECPRHPCCEGGGDHWSSASALRRAAT